MDLASTRNPENHFSTLRGYGMIVAER